MRGVLRRCRTKKKELLRDRKQTRFSTSGKGCDPLKMFISWNAENVHFLSKETNVSSPVEQGPSDPYRRCSSFLGRPTPLLRDSSFGCGNAGTASPDPKGDVLVSGHQCQNHTSWTQHDHTVLFSKTWKAAWSQRKYILWQEWFFLARLWQMMSSYCFFSPRPSRCGEDCHVQLPPLSWGLTSGQHCCCLKTWCHSRHPAWLPAITSEDAGLSRICHIHQVLARGWDPCNVRTETRCVLQDLTALPLYS